MRPPIWAVALTITATASTGLLLLLLEPVSDVRWPFVYAAAGSALLSAAAGALDLVERHRTRNSRRIIANLPTVGHDTEQAGHFQTDPGRRLLADAYDVFDEETPC